MAPGRLPHAVEHMAVWEHSQHDVVSGGIMNEGPLGVNKEDIGNPDLLHKPAVKGHALVAGAGEGQPLILPVMPQVQRHCEVLGAREEARSSLNRTA